MIEFLRELFFRDKVLKLFSLTLAVLIWATVSIAILRDVSVVPGSNSTYSRTFYDQPVTVISISKDTTGYRVQPGEVDITLQGDREGLRNLKSEQIHALVYLSEPKNGPENRGRIEVTTPPGFTHVSVVPAEVLVVPPAKDFTPLVRTNSP
jgi:YbbR domain-containing protein